MARGSFGKRNMVTIMATVCLMLVQFAMANVPCPMYCRCNSGLTIILCSGLKLTRIPAIPSTARELYLDRNNLQTIANNSFHNLKNLEFLSLEKNEIVLLSVNAFQGLNSLLRLKMGHNQLIDLPRHLFRIPRRMTHLDLSRNRFKKLPSSSVHHLEYLVHLNMSFNQITDPKLGSGFKNTRKVKVLDLSHNNFMEIQATTFSPMLWWEDGAGSIHLNISFCNIKTLHQLAFSQLVNIGALHLSGNQGISLQQLKTSLKNIGGQGSPALEILKLSSMNISDPSLLLADLRFSSLKLLDLSRNAITVIRQRPFRYLQMLETLDLSHNTLTSAAGLHGLNRLKVLKLSYNVISTISAVVMQPLTNLKELHLNNNVMTRINDEPFEDLHELIHLDVSYNLIKTFDVIYLEQVEVLNVKFNSLTSMGSIPRKLRLKSLDISQNRLDKLEANMFLDSSQLQSVNFSRNLIHQVSNNTFKSYTPHIIDLSYNQLDKLEYYGWTTVVDLYLQGNKIRNVETSALKGLHWLKKIDISLNSIKDMSSSHVADLHSLEELYLGRNELHEVIATEKGAKLFSNLPDLKVVNLSANKIDRIHPQLMNKLTKLEKLDLSVNSIKNVTFIKPEVLVQLEHMSLSNNKIEIVDPKPLEALALLMSVDLSYNPFYCSCDLVPFREWVRKTHVTVVNFSSKMAYKCQGPDMWQNHGLRSFSLSKVDCKESFDKRIIFIAIGGFGLIIIIIGGILFYRHRWRIKRKLARKQQYGMIHQNDTLHLQQQQHHPVDQTANGNSNGNSNGNGNPSWI